jgi:hypothetical protein
MRVDIVRCTLRAVFASRLLLILLTLVTGVTTAASATEVVTVTSPADGATVASPVSVHATFNGTASYMKIWVDGVAGVFQDNTSVFNTTVTLAPGKHLLQVQAHDPSINTTFTTSVDITVIAGVTITPGSASVVEGGTQQFTANVPVTWAATGSGTINSSGLFSAGQNAGTATVTATATSGGATASATVLVAALAVTPSATSTVVGATQQFSTNAPATWGASCGTISSSGLFTAPSTPQTCTITATQSNGPSATATATDNVVLSSVPLVTVQTPAAGSIVGSPVIVHASFNAPASYMKVWLDHVAGPYQDNTSVFNVSLNVATGSHLIEVQADDSNNKTVYTTPVTFTVSNAVTVSPAAPSLAEGATQQFTANLPVTWSATGDGTIDANGLFTAGQTVGSATITATDAGVSLTGTATVSVVPLAVSPSVASTVEGATQQFNANASVTWSTSCGAINAGGLFTAPATTGSCTITANQSNGSGITATATDNVITPPNPSTLSYTTWKNDNARTGQQPNESVLTPANVNSTTFGVLFSAALDGQVFAQPLYLPGLSINGATHNVVFIVTQHASVYAFDADTAGPALWHTTFLKSGVTTVPPSFLGTGIPITTEISCTGTPVIDPIVGTLYLACETLENNAVVHRLHALNVLTGQEVAGSPVVIAPNGFQGKEQLQRPGLLLANGELYIALGSQGDIPPYHGWILAYSPTSLMLLNTWNVTPNGTEGAIWMAGQALAEDSNGDIYASTANGTFDGATDFGMSFVHLDPNLNVLDYFSPHNEAVLSAGDEDLGSGGLLVVPDQSGPFPHILIGAGKPASIYVVNRDNMGHINTGSNSQIIQDLQNAVGGGGPRQPNDHCFMTPAFWEQNLYFACNNDVMKAFSLSATTGMLSTAPTSKGGFVFTFPGAQPVVSSDGSTNGIVWAVDTSSKLHAFDATNVAKEIYTSGALGFSKWAVPTVINGKVYVATQGKLWVFGLF